MSNYTNNLRLALPITGTLDGVWGEVVNDEITRLVESAIAGLTIVTLADADKTLTAFDGLPDESRAMFLQFEGALTAPRTLTCPPFSKLYFVRNATTGGHDLTFKTTSGAAYVVPPGHQYALQCTGTDVFLASFSDMEQVKNILAVSNGGTGASTPAGARFNLQAAWTGGDTYTGIHNFLGATVQVPTLPLGTTGALAASLDFVRNEFAPIDSPSFTGLPTAPTLPFGTAGNNLATLDFVRNEFAPIDSPSFTGLPTAPTLPFGTAGNNLATIDYVNQATFQAELPAQLGSGGKFLSTDGVNAFWEFNPTPAFVIMSFGVV